MLLARHAAWSRTEAIPAALASSVNTFLHTGVQSGHTQELG